MKTKSGERKRAMAKAAKAMLLLSRASVLLEECGAVSAADQSRKALSETTSFVEQKRGEAIDRKVQKSNEPCMPSDETSLIRSDGTLRYVSYMKSAGKRPEVVAVSFRKPGLPSLTTSFTLEGRSFKLVYELAVMALATHLGVRNDEKLVSSMKSTRGAFRKRYMF